MNLLATCVADALGDVGSSTRRSAVRIGCVCCVVSREVVGPIGGCNGQRPGRVRCPCILYTLCYGTNTNSVSKRGTPPPESGIKRCQE